jgi:hypothetical protein
MNSLVFEVREHRFDLFKLVERRYFILVSLSFGPLVELHLESVDLLELIEQVSDALYTLGPKPQDTR